MHNFVVIGWAYFKPELSKFWPNFEFDSNNVSRRGHGNTIVEIRTRISNHIFTKIRNICKICNYLSRPQYKTMFPKSPCVNIEYTTVCHYTHRVLLLYILVSMAYFAIWSLPRLKIYARISRRETHFDVYSYMFAPMICARIDYDEPTQSSDVWDWRSFAVRDLWRTVADPSTLRAIWCPILPDRRIFNLLSRSTY